MPIAKPKPVFDNVTPLDTGANNPRAVLGGNKPPLEELIPLEFRTALLADQPNFLTVMENSIAAADRAMATDDETLGRCADLIKKYRAIASHINATHTAVKEPHLLASRLCDAEKNALAGRVAIAKAKVEAVGDAYQAKKDAAERAERERIAAEQRAAADRAAAAERARVQAEQEAAAAARAATNEAEREAAQERARLAAEEAEAAARAAALAPSAPAKADPVRSDAGASVSGKQEWVCEVEDYAAAFRAVKTDQKVKEAIDAAIKRQVRAGSREIKGVKIWPVSKANFR